MDKQDSSDTENDKLLPGTLLDSDESSHHYLSHEHQHPLKYTPPSLVEV